MNEVASKFASLEAEIAEKKGNFYLFALILREDLPDRWDLVISAPWAVDQQETVHYLVDEIRSHLGPEYLIQLARIVVVDYNDPFVQKVTSAFQVEHGMMTVLGPDNFFRLPVRHAFIITSKRPSDYQVVSQTGPSR